MKAYLITFVGGITRKVYDEDDSFEDIFDMMTNDLDGSPVYPGFDGVIYFTPSKVGVRMDKVLFIEEVEE